MWQSCLSNFEIHASGKEFPLNMFFTHAHSFLLQNVVKSEQQEQEKSTETVWRPISLARNDGIRYPILQNENL